MLALDFENENHQCIFCRNLQNYHEFKIEKSKLVELAGQNLNKIRKDLNKDQLFETRPYENNYYFPQPLLFAEKQMWEIKNC